MNINITLVMQAIHFGIAYIILERLLIRPLVAIIQQEEKSEHDLELVIQQAEQTLQERYAFAQKRWHEYQEYYKSSTPALSTVQYEQKQIPYGTTIRFSPEQLQSYIQELSTYLEQRIEHGRI